MAIFPEPVSPGAALTPRPRHQPGEHTLGWGFVGASAVASRFMVAAIRTQTPMTAPSSRVAMTNGWIVGIFSHDETRARRFADANQIPHTFVNLADLLEHPEIQCVYISGHPRHHAQATLAALAAGKHVLCEMPLALDLNDALSATHTALNRGLTLAVNFQRRGDPAIRLLREMVGGGELGDLLGGCVDNIALLPSQQQTWRLRAQGGGVIWDRTVHDIDLLRYLLRDDIAAIYAMSTQHLLGAAVEEDVLSQVTMRRSGLVFQLHDSFLIPHGDTALELHGTTGTALVRHCFSAGLSTELWLTRHGRSTQLALPAADPYSESVHAFGTAVRTGALPLATGTDGVHSLLVAFAALESVRRSQRVLLDEPLRPVSDFSVL